MDQPQAETEVTELIKKLRFLCFLLLEEQFLLRASKGAPRRFRASGFEFLIRDGLSISQ